MGSLDEAGPAQVDSGSNGGQLGAPVSDALPQVRRRRCLHAHASLSDFHGDREVSEPRIYHLQGNFLTVNN